MKIPNDDFPGNDLPNMRCVVLPVVDEQPSRASKILAAGIRKEEEEIFSEIKREREKDLIAYMRRQLQRIIYDELTKDFIKKGIEMYDREIKPKKVEIVPLDKGYLVIWSDEVERYHHKKDKTVTETKTRKVAVPDTRALLFEIASRDRAALETLQYNEAAVTVAKDACDRARILSDMMGEIIMSLDSVENVQGSRRKELVNACNKINKELMKIWSKRLRR